MNNKTKEFLIPFIGLKEAKYCFDYQLTNSFFDIFEYDEFKDSNIKVEVVLDKKSNMLEFNFNHSGSVNVPCDVTGEDFDLSIKGKMKLIVVFGEAYNDDNEELLVLPFGEFEINIAQYLYEMIVLSVPLRRVHPGVTDGSLKSEVLEKLHELAVKEIKVEKKIKENKQDDIDPRWDKLKQLLTDK